MSLTIGEIMRIAQCKEKETISTELKSLRKIIPFDEDQKRDIAYEIIAFANRQGGKIIFGINENGQPDERHEIDIDKIKSKLHNLCFHSISPVIECSTQFIDEPEGQFFIIYVPKRKGLPCAYVPNRSGSEINGRIYYIRTSHGKKLVSDSQLEWLFLNQNDPNYNHSFRIAFEFDKQLNFIDGIVPWGNYSFLPFRELLNPNDKSAIKAESKKFILLMNELLPYLILSSLSNYFKDSWHIGISEEFDRMNSGPMITSVPIPSTPVYIHEIPILGSSFVNKLSWNFKQILKELFPRKFHIPENTEIIITHKNDGNAASITLSNQAFEMEILTGMLSGGVGLHQNNFSHEILSDRYPSYYELSSSKFLYLDTAGYLNAKFNYPEYDMNGFNEYLNYYNSLKKLLDYNWNFEVARNKHPVKEILVVNDKLDEILGLLQSGK